MQLGASLSGIASEAAIRRFRSILRPPAFMVDVAEGLRTYSGLYRILVSFSGLGLSVAFLSRAPGAHRFLWESVAKLLGLWR